MRITAIIISFFCVFGGISAQNYTISGKIVDSKTSEAIEMAGVRLMRSDSSYVDGMSTIADGSFRFKVKNLGKYILKYTSMGYYTKYSNITLSKQKSKVDIGVIPLVVNAIALQQATVKTHVSQVEVKEDTSVFNASAYRTPDGSTLEALVEKLPGVEVEDDGSIKLNGKTVSQILIDGKDFFKGDTKVAMKNLPVDLIDKIKSYERESDYKRQTGIDDGNEETVLDVGLKQKLKSSWISNVDLGAGNKNRYAERIFISRFTDNSRISAVGAMNNVNDRGFRGGGGGFRGGASGLTATRSAGLDGFWNNGVKEDSARYFQIGGNFRINHSSSDNLTRSNSETFLTSGSNSFSNSSSQSYGKSTGMNAGLNLEWKPDVMTSLHLRSNFSHSTSDNDGTSRSATFKDNPYNLGESPLDSMFWTDNAILVSQAFQNIATNRNHRLSLSDGKSNNINGELNVTRRLSKKGRSISFRGEAGYSSSTSHSFSISDIYYYQRASQTYNNQYTDAPSKSRNLSGQLSYSEPLWKDWYLQSSYEYRYRFSDRERNLYQLDSLSGWNAGNTHPIGSLPEDAVLNTVRNMENSQYATYKDYIHQANVGIRYATKDINFHAGIRLQPQHTNLAYQKSALDTIVTRNVFNIAPDLRLRYRFNQNTRLDFRYRGSSSQPSMTDLLDVTDDSDPLNISKGNPGLKPSWSNDFRLFFNTYTQKHQQSIFVHVGFNQTSNSISNAVTYDEATGIRVTRPENINGNWNTNAFGGYNRAFGKDNEFTMHTGTSFNYSNSVGYMRTSNIGNSEKNTVKTLNLGERLRASYRKDLFEFGISGSINYSKSHSQLSAASNLETFRFSYGCNLQYTTPWNTGVSTDIGMNSRRGYDDASMNTNELIWNAQISQTLFNKSTTLSIQFYDLLHQQSNISRNINAQMRRDTWSNAVNSYFMVHLVYRLNIFGGAGGRIRGNNRDMRGGERDFGGGGPGYGGGYRGGGFGGRM